jgi:hypothetical protein
MEKDIVIVVGVVGDKVVSGGHEGHVAPVAVHSRCFTLGVADFPARTDRHQRDRFQVTAPSASAAAGNKDKDSSKRKSSY